MIEALYTILASKYRVGYHPEKDELFLYTVSEDGLCTVFVRGQLDAMWTYVGNKGEKKTIRKRKKTGSFGAQP